MSRKITISSVLLLVLSVVSFASEEYPKLAISGYKSYFTASFNVAPDRAYFSALDNSDFIPMVSNGGPWQEQLSLRVNSRLNDDWRVNYGLMQLPVTLPH
ncbi:MAG: hypothetical protein WCW67_04560 [Candidatus Margulisiibacteriota bacterium]